MVILISLFPVIFAVSTKLKQKREMDQKAEGTCPVSLLRSQYWK